MGLMSLFPTQLAVAATTLAVGSFLTGGFSRQSTSSHHKPLSACIDELSSYLEVDQTYLLTLKQTKEGATATLSWGGKEMRLESFSLAGTCQWTEGGSGNKDKVQTNVTASFLKATQGLKKDRALAPILKSSFELALKWFPTKTEWMFRYHAVRPEPVIRQELTSGFSAAPDAYSVDIVMLPSEAGAHLTVHVSRTGRILGVTAGM
jgi:hypothetical protein